MFEVQYAGLNQQKVDIMKILAFIAGYTNRTPPGLLVIQNQITGLNRLVIR